MSVLLRLRSLEAPVHQTGELRRCLRLHDLLLFGFSTVVGAGIFVTVGVAGQEAGPGLILAFFLAGICCSMTALCYAELATRFPYAGSIYNFTARCLGDYFAWIVGFSLIVDGVVSSAAIAKACVAYLAQLLTLAGIQMPAVIVSLKVNVVISISLGAPWILAGVGYTTYKGVKTMTRFNNAVASANIAIILLVIGAGFTMIEAENYDPFLPGGMEGVERAAALTFFAMFGFDAATSLAEETIEPEKVLPRAIMWTVFLTTAMYMCISAVFCGLVPRSAIDDGAPLAKAFTDRGAPILATVIALGAVGNTSTSLLGNLVRLPRFILRMSSDGHLPRRFAKVDPATDAPSAALAISIIISMVLSAIVSFAALVQAASVGGLIGFSLVNSSVLLVRCRPPPARGAALAQVPQDDRLVTPPAHTFGASAELSVPADSMSEAPESMPSPVAYESEAAGDAGGSPWEEAPDGVVRLAAWLFTYWLLTLVFDFAVVLDLHPALVFLFAFAAAVCAGCTARCYQGQAHQTDQETKGERIFRTPYLPWLPLVAIVANNFIIANLPPPAMLRFLLLEMACGSLVYFCRLRFRGVRAIRKMPASAVRKIPGMKPRRPQRIPGVVSDGRAYAGFDLEDDDADACTSHGRAIAAGTPAEGVAYEGFDLEEDEADACASHGHASAAGTPVDDSAIDNN